MTEAERYLKYMRFESVDRPPLCLSGGWHETSERWHREGWPEGVSLNEYFDVEPVGLACLGINVRFCPDFEEKVLEETDDYQIVIDRHGVKAQRLKGASASGAAHYLEYPVKGPQDMGWIAQRLDPADPRRIPDDLDAQLEELTDHPNRLGLMDCGSFFGYLHESMGTEPTCMAFHDHPEFVHAFNDRLSDVIAGALRRVLPHPAIRIIGGHEDMAFKNGPLIGPDMVREFMLPYYRKTVPIAQEAGLDIFCMDSDGDCRQIIPLWLEVGINGITPCEVAAGMDVRELRAEYGHDLLLWGGMDKRALAAGKDAIRTEVLSKVPPLIAEGGYIPGVDHGVPPDVSWENFCYYTNLLKQVYGM